VVMVASTYSLTSPLAPVENMQKPSRIPNHREGRGRVETAKAGRVGLTTCQPLENRHAQYQCHTDLAESQLYRLHDLILFDHVFHRRRGDQKLVDQKLEDV